MQPLQKLENHFAGPEIQVAGRFVGEQNGRFSHQSTGEHHPLLFAAGKFSGAM